MKDLVRLCGCFHLKDREFVSFQGKGNSEIISRTLHSKISLDLRLKPS
jgi:hypothetical protein